AFKDERIALEKALQTLINDNDHDGLDLEGRTVDVDRPIDVHAAVGNRSSFTARRTIRNGRIRAVDSPFWASIGVTRNANYVSGAKTLTGISSAGDVEVGAIVTGAGVGREIYVRSVNASAGEVTLSKPLFAAAANQNYAFVRHKYILDFAGFNFLSNFELSGVSLEGGGFASCLILPPDGFNWRIHNSWFMRPKDRGITSCGNGDFAMSIENCEFHSNEQDTANGNRTTIALNCNANDNRIRHCRGARFLHFAVLGGTNIMFQSNHIYQGSEGSSSRLAGVVFTETKINSTVSGNYIDNCWIEWSNEHAVNISSSSIFGSLTVNDNLFFASNVAEASFRFLYLKPFASGMGLVDLSVTDNTFRVSGGSINRAEGVLSDGGSLDPDRFKNIRFAGNGFEAVNTAAQNPLRVEYSLASGSASNAWFVNSNGQLPFNGPARNVDAVVATSEIRNGGGGGVTAMPWTQSQQGGGSLIRLNWPQAVHGSVAVTMRGDQPD
ncbi:MAG: right-handed parallel beta-helix repeat-containing protein, partial [Pseudomonadota bacterium]